MTMTRKIQALVAFAAIGLGSASCNGASAPTAVDSVITPLVFNNQTYAGTLAVGGTGFYSILVSQAGPVGINLAAVQTPGGAALSFPMGIGIGVPKGTACARTASQNATPGLATQLTVTVNPGTYCVAVFDVGNLTGTVNFAMRITHP
jgi:hypothetical protein